MKAIVYKRYGPPDVLELTELEKPAPKSNEVLINVRAVEVTKTDCEMRSFHLPVAWTWLPMRLVMGLRKPRRGVLGIYFSGEVEAVGERVTTFAKGDQVFGSTGLKMGAYAQYMCLPEDHPIVLKPKTINFEEAAAVPLGGLNALHFIEKARIQRGEKVLINGAGGSIGTFAVQLAKRMGAEVTAVDSSFKEPMLRRIGAEHFIDYSKEDFTKNGQHYDVILSVVAQSSYAQTIQSLSPKGRYLLANPRLADMVRAVITSRFTDKKVIYAVASETKEQLRELGSLIEEGELNATLDRVYPLADVVEAHRRVETEQRLGSVVISLEE